ncbi:MAG TPA: T9SS type A sorting domain-containing protein [Ignavibacteriales bacterium]|nr:T9SS type A sorting domain-containing protein [Ignavibacteriales bacterium]
MKVFILPVKFSSIFLIVISFLYQNADAQTKIADNKPGTYLQLWRPYNHLQQLPTYLLPSDPAKEDNACSLPDKKFRTSGNKSHGEAVYKGHSQEQEWERMDSPWGGCLRRFYEFNDSMYALTDGDIYRYENNRWSSLHMDNLYFVNSYQSLHKFPSGRMVASSDCGVFCSDDNGKSWRPLSIGQYGYTDIAIQDYFVLAQNEVLLATSKGIFVTKNEGKDFSLLSMENTYVQTIKADGSGYLWVSTQFGVYKARYTDLIWLKIAPEDAKWAKILFDSKGTVYLSTREYIYKSTDSGLSWGYLNGFFEDMTLDNSENLVITGSSQLFFADDQGIKTSSCPSGISLLTTFINGKGEYVVGTLGAGAAIYEKTKDTFTDFSNGLNASTVRTIQPLANGSLLISTDSYCFFMSKDRGSTWERTYDHRSLLMKTDKNNSTYAAANSGIIRSDDFGITWKRLNINVYPYFISAFDISDDCKTICAGSSIGEVYVSNDAGRSFTKRKKENYSFVDAIKVIDKNTFLIYRDSLYLTLDNGKTFKYINDPRIGRIGEIVTDKMNYIYLASVNGVFRSKDFENWIQLKLKGGSWNTPAFIRLDPNNNLFVVSTNGLVQASGDYGETWQILVYSEQWLYFWSFAMDQDGNLYCGSQNSGLYHAKIDFSQVERNPVVVKNLTLSNNFPNPFNSSTQIQYEIPKASYVTLKVYSILGQELETLISGFMDSGSYHKIWDASKYPSGIYIYKLQSGDQSQTKKMILLR